MTSQPSVKRVIPGLEDLNDQDPGAGDLYNDKEVWTDIVDQEVKDYDAYNHVFKHDETAHDVFQDDVKMPSFFNISQSQYQAAIQTADPFEQHMAHLRQSFDQIMHQNYQLEQSVNKKVLHM